METLIRDRVSFAPVYRCWRGLCSRAAKKIENPFPHLRRVLFAGTPLDAALAREFVDKFSAEVMTGYGMTEAVPVTMALDMAQVPEGSVGSVARELQLRISSRRRATQSFPPK